MQRSTFLCLLTLAAACGCYSTQTETSTQPKAVQVEKSKEAEEPKSQLLDESWHAVFLMGAKVGYGHTVAKLVDHGDGPVVETTSEQEIRVKRDGQTTAQRVEIRSIDSPGGAFVRFDSAMGGQRVRGEVRGDMLRLTMDSGGRPASAAIPWDDDIAGCFGLEDSLRRQPMKPGEKRKVRWFQPLINVVTAEQLTAGSLEQVDLLGEQRKLLRIASTVTFEGQTLERILWCDDQGRVWKSATPAMGEEQYRTTREKAQANEEKTLDLMLRTMVRLPEALGDASEAAVITYRAHLKHGDPSKLFASCGSQAVKAIDEHTAEIIVRRVTPSSPNKLSDPCSGPTPADRAPNHFIESNDPAVLKLAEEVPAERSPAETAIALERYVRARLTERNYATVFDTAAQVAKSLSGDCTEHAVLLAALCRAKKIPARVAAGLVYVPEQQGFAFHMWTEAWINDRWVPLDATRPEGGVGPDHIKLFDTPLDGVSGLATLLPVMNVIGQLELEVVSVERKVD
jgi:hypothetical protein